MLVASLLLALQAAAAEPAKIPDATLAAGPLEVRAWLALDEVDGRGRRPFRPEAVLARHLVDPGAPAPREGETIAGERGEATWTRRDAGEDGRIRAAWAFARVESASARVVLARLEGAGTLFVNGAPHAGDLYGLGFGGVPVALAEGLSELYVTGVRGAFRLTLVPPEAPLLLATWDLTLPTLTAGEPIEHLLGLRVVNASTAWLGAVEIEVGGSELVEPARARFEPGLAPLGIRQLAVPLRSREGATAPAEPGQLSLTVTLRAGGIAPRSTPLALSVRAKGALKTVTRGSAIDGSVQRYAVLPPSGERAPDAPMRLLLSLHGAGVECEGQAGSYAPKPDFWIVAPTNRRAFGFDWQDWGRLDAYEALEHALGRTGVAREHVHLSGHSMGGHGTWHLAANDLDGFASIAPSAGWRSFDSYGGRPEGALRELWHAADAASRTEDRVAELARIPTYVLHGEADDNVPASEAHAMVAALRVAGGEPRAHFEEGAGHWWDSNEEAGAACVDWPGFFELFRATSVPTKPLELDWTAVGPGVDWRHHWVEVRQVFAYGEPFTVRARCDPGTGRVEVATANVRRFVLGQAPLALREVVLDGQRFEPGTLQFVRTPEGWETAPSIKEPEKWPRRSGPLKRAFDADFVLVVPTGGDAEEREAALARATYDQEQWSYRGNGDAELVTDAWAVEHAAELVHRNVVLYGNADTNAAWASFVPPDYPARIERGKVRLGEREWEGEALGLLAVAPKGVFPGTLVALLGSSGPQADRVAASLALFVSGVGYPDYAVFGPEVLASGDGGVLAAGFLDHAWRLPE